MDTTDTTEAGADKPTADTGGAVSLLRLMPPTAWEGMLVIGKIATDAKAYRRALRGLHDAAVATTATQDARERQLDAREKELDARAAKLAAGEAALADEQKKLRDREVAHFVEKNRWDDAQKLREGSAVRNSRHPDDDFVPIQGSGMSRTFTAPPRTVRTDALGQPFPEHTTLTRDEPGPEAA
jgi:hypothetical protein